MIPKIKIKFFLSYKIIQIFKIKINYNKMKLNFIIKIRN